MPKHDCAECDTCIHEFDSAVCEMCTNCNFWASIEEEVDEDDWLFSPEEQEEESKFRE